MMAMPRPPRTFGSSSCAKDADAKPSARTAPARNRIVFKDATETTAPLLKTMSSASCSSGVGSPVMMMTLSLLTSQAWPIVPSRVKPPRVVQSIPTTAWTKADGRSRMLSSSFSSSERSCEGASQPVAPRMPTPMIGVTSPSKKL